MGTASCTQSIWGKTDWCHGRRQCLASGDAWISRSCPPILVRLCLALILRGIHSNEYGSHAAIGLGKLLFPLFALALNIPENFFDDKVRRSTFFCTSLNSLFTRQRTRQRSCVFFTIPLKLGRWMTVSLALGHTQSEIRSLIGVTEPDSAVYRSWEVRMRTIPRYICGCELVFCSVLHHSLARTRNSSVAGA
jgi:hypothetical protein